MERDILSYRLSGSCGVQKHTKFAYKHRTGHKLQAEVKKRGKETFFFWLR